MHLWVGMSLFFGEGSLFFFVKGKLVFYWWSETRLVGRKPRKFNNFGKFDVPDNAIWNLIFLIIGSEFEMLFFFLSLCCPFDD